MEQFANPISEQVREVVEAVVEALRVPKPDELSPSVASSSFEAEALRAEIIRAGRKLWERQYVDGNGGNISCRLGTNYVLCTPTMMSKRRPGAGGYLFVAIWTATLWPVTGCAPVNCCCILRFIEPILGRAQWCIVIRRMRQRFR